jgi:glycosyltransferase involved in cell wall biosynthesis
MGILRAHKHVIAYRLLSALPDAVFAVSEQVRKHCIEVDRIDPERVQTIYNGLDLSEWDYSDRAETTPSRPLITTVGNIRRVKGHDIFIQAAASVVRQYPNAIFSIAGGVLDPDYFKELQDLVRDLGLTDCFYFAGAVTDLHQHLSAADVFVLPSRSEGFSNAIIEAMAASLPVVATNVGGNAEAVKDGINGLLVPPDDSMALAKAIAHLLSDPSQARKMGIAGKTIVAENFTTEAMMTKITRTYKDLLSRG